jgi:hypothetical protein
MHPALDFFTIQNMAFSFAQCRVMSVPNFTSTMKGRGYTLVDQWQIVKRDYRTPFSPKHGVKHYSGLVLQHANTKPLEDLD